MSTTRILAILTTAGALLLAGCSGDDDPDPAASTGTATVPAPSGTATVGPPQDQAARTTIPREVVPSGTEGTPRGTDLTPGEVDRTDPDAVTDAVLTIMHSHDTALDLSPSDAPRRATGLMTPEYAEQTNTLIPGGGGADWIALADVSGYTTVQLEAAGEHDAPEDTATEAYRQRIVTVTSHTDAGEETGEPQHYVTWVILTRPSETDPWSVATVDISPF